MAVPSWGVSFVSLHFSLSSNKASKGHSESIMPSGHNTMFSRESIHQRPWWDKIVIYAEVFE
jgi:hypothetical protein